VKNLTIAILCTASLAFIAAPTHAESSFTTGPFVGLSLGGAGLMPRSIGLVETGENEHDTGTGKLTAGYWFSPPALDCAGNSSQWNSDGSLASLAAIATCLHCSIPP